MSKETQKRLYLERKNAGLCTICGKAASTGVRCDECLTKSRNLRRARITQELCGRCGQPAIKNQTLCLKHSTENKRSGRISKEKLKIETFEAYGGVRCSCCGETELWVLCLDHINNDGWEERARLNNTGGYKFYRYLRKLGYPDKDRYRVLCANCNFIAYAEGDEHGS